MWTPRHDRACVPVPSQVLCWALGELHKVMSEGPALHPRCWTPCALGFVPQTPFVQSPSNHHHPGLGLGCRGEALLFLHHTFYLPTPSAHCPSALEGKWRKSQDNLAKIPSPEGAATHSYMRKIKITVFLGHKNTYIQHRWVFDKVLGSEKIRPCVG